MALVIAIISDSLGVWLKSRIWLFVGLVSIPICSYTFASNSYSGIISASKSASRTITVQDLKLDSTYTTGSIVSNADVMENTQVKEYIDKTGNYNNQLYDTISITMSPILTSEARKAYLSSRDIHDILDINISIQPTSKQLQLHGILTKEVRNAIDTYKLGDTYLIRSDNSASLDEFVDKDISVTLTYGSAYENDKPLDVYLITNVTGRGTS